MASFNYGYSFGEWRRIEYGSPVLDEVKPAPERIFSEYELAVIGYYERFGYVERRDQYIIDDYQTIDQPDGYRQDTRELERPELSPYDEPEVGLPPEYPFQDFNYGP